MPMGIDLSKEQITVIPDVTVKVLDDTYCFTDGSGFIEEDLVPAVEIENGCSSIKTLSLFEPSNAFELEKGQFEQMGLSAPSKPTVVQVRGYYYGLLFKGTFLVVKKIPRRLRQMYNIPPSSRIVIRESMVKVRMNKADKKTYPGPNSIEICRTSHACSQQRLNQALCLLLENAGVPAALMIGLAQKELDEVSKALTDRASALRAIQRRDFQRELDMKDQVVVKMLLSGVSLDDPYLQRELRQRQQKSLQSLKKGRVAVSDTLYLIGVPDPLGELKENEIMVLVQGQRLCGPCLVYRHPARLSSSVQKLQAVDSPCIMAVLTKNAQNCVIFPTVGARPLPDAMGGGDLDGDMYWVTFHPQILQTFRAQPPPEKAKLEAQSPPLDPIPEDPSNLLVKHFVSLQSSFRTQVGFVSNLQMAAMDEKGPDCWEAVLLTALYEAQLDAGKTGQLVSVPRELQQLRLPHYLKENGRKSTSVAGRIYDLVAQKESFLEEEQSISLDLDMVLSEERTWKSEVEWASRQLEEYNAQITNLGENMWEAFWELVERFRKKLLKGVDWERSFHSPSAPMEVLIRASACYFVTYKKAQEGRRKRGRNSEGGLRRAALTFPWLVAGEFLCELKARKSGSEGGLLGVSATFEALFRKKAE